MIFALSPLWPLFLLPGPMAGASTVDGIVPTGRFSFGPDSKAFQADRPAFDTDCRKFTGAIRHGLSGAAQAMCATGYPQQVDAA
jgi:hypothetical protein